MRIQVIFPQPMDLDAVLRESSVTALQRKLAQVRHGETPITIGRATPDDQVGFDLHRPRIQTTSVGMGEFPFLSGIADRAFQRVVNSVAMSKGSGRKEAILDKCRKLRSYLASEPQIGLTPYLQDLGAIEQRAREASESELSPIDRALATLVIRLQERDRGDDSGTINAQRWEKLFGGDDPV